MKSTKRMYDMKIMKMTISSLIVNCKCKSRLEFLNQGNYTPSPNDLCLDDLDDTRQSLTIHSVYLMSTAQSVLHEINGHSDLTNIGAKITDDVDKAVKQTSKLELQSALEVNPRFYLSL